MKQLKTFILIINFSFFSILTCIAKTPSQDTSSDLRTAKYSSRSPNEALAWQNDLRTKLSRLLKIDDLITQKPSIPLNPHELLTHDKESFTIKELEINSTPNRRIRIILTLPRDAKAPYPAVVCLGGHGSNLYSPYHASTVSWVKQKKASDRIYKAFATELASRGYATISTTVSQHNVYEKDRSLMGERLWDSMRCIDYLETLPQADKNRIGCAGLSLGGEMTMWLGAMDPRLAAVISAGFLTYMDQMEKNHCMCWKFPGLRDLADFSDIYSLIAPRPLQCQNGIKEPQTQFYVPRARKAAEEIRTIYVDFDRPENLILDVHPGGHEIDLAALLYFFQKHLHHP
jgi:dienelactone hydrolase